MEEHSEVRESPKALAQRHLTAAMVCGLGSFCVFLGASLALAEQGYENDWLVVAMWVINLNTARHLGLAARAMGRNGWLWGGFAAIWTATALPVYLVLNLQHLLGRYPRA
ncbi:hypothetical protein [Stenotrophomonas oahuensis]|uniref:Transmembrane protein n=1 Tax=Stenotrophomonas oahuensis TaxID=3003271 RepID=A0ABY9YK27_9GAMM|nr:hypothetical protein [Stenotrophomonas sp. A5586]WNH51227.1 hypothetical protein PDM29_12710 [Stenotrophomonas sp. A5586]